MKTTIMKTTVTKTTTISTMKSLLMIMLAVITLLVSAMPAFAADNNVTDKQVLSSIANYTCDWYNGVYEVCTNWYFLDHPGGYCPEKCYGLDSEGNLFILPSGAENREDGRGGTEKFRSAYNGDYALLSGGIVIDRKGNTVFDVADTDYDEIYSGECLDVGYVICSKDVNTFSDTSTHYYSVNVKDGTSQEIICNEEGGSADWQKTFGKDKGAFYLTNGYYFTWTYEKDDLIYTGFYDLINNKTFIAVPSEDSVDKDRETISFNYSLPWYSDGTYFYTMSREDQTSMRCTKLDLKARTVSEVILDETRIAVDNNTSSVLLGHGFIDFREGPDHIAMYDMVHDKLYDTSDFYGEMSIVDIMEDSSILMKVKNSGGGHFIALLDAQNGNFVFEPIPYSNDKEELGFQYSENAMLTREDDNTYHLYDWNGNELKVFTIEKGDYSSEYWLAGNMVISFPSYGGYNPTGAYLIPEQREIEIDYKAQVSDISGENSNIEFIACNNGSYLFRFNGYNIGTEDALLLGNEDLSSWIRISYSDFERLAGAF